MRVLNIANRLLSRATLSTGRSLGLTHIPTCFNRKFILQPTDVWTSLYWQYEAYNAAILRQNLKKGDFFLDVGAHHGLWSLYAAKLVGRNGMVLSCEPSPAFVKLARAALPYPQMRPVHIGLGAREAELSFFAQGDATSGSFVSEVTEINRSFSPDVPVEQKTIAIKPLDSLVVESGRPPNFIKIDVEGFELQVLKGAEHTLGQSDLRALLIEIHPQQLALSGGTESELFALLSNHGFGAKVIDRNPNSLYTILSERTRKTS